MKVCSVCRRCYEDSALSCAEDNHDILSEARAGSCEIIPNYRLEVLHESDATSETFRAVNTILNKPYLIKIVAPAAFDETTKKQFLAEAQALAAIIHPNVARVFESGTLPDASLYVVTEYFEAQTLRECFENVGKPTEVTALTILRQAAEGLEGVHAAGILHRNLKPENIILTSDAENKFLIKLQNIDFGALRQKQVNANGDLFLTDLRYFSPEQCSSENADAQTDVYALGVVLYEALAGKVPFDAAYADALIIKQISEHPPEVKINSFDLRMLLTHTLTDALQKTTRARLKTANAMARRLRHIEQLATHSSTPPPAMAYPAAMNKTAVAFTPPAKVEKSAEIETPVETVPVTAPASIVENVPAIVPPVIVENVAAPETAALAETVPAMEAAAIIEDAAASSETELVEDAAVAETALVVEDAASFETAATIENLPVTAAALDIEEVPVTAPAIVVEDLPLIETRTVAETQPAIEIPLMETQPAFEAPAFVEEAALAETPAVVEEIPVTETASFVEETPVAEIQSIADEIPVAETPTVFETLPSVEVAVADEKFVEREAVAESFAFAENDAAVEQVTLAESDVANVAVENVFAGESETVIETADAAEAEIAAVEAAELQTAPAETAEAQFVAAETAETQFVAEETPSPAFAVVDYSTTKLPPIEKIISAPDFKVTEIETIFSLKRGNFDIHKTSEPVLIEWEQPDDVPTTTAALNISKKQFADVQFVQNADVADEKIADAVEAEEAETDEVEYVSEAHKTRRDYASVSSVFASYEDSAGRSWNLPGKRAVITGAAICGLMIIAVGGVFLNRQMQSTDTQTSAAKSAPVEKTLPKPAASQQNAETVASAKPEASTVSSVETTDAPEVPNYEPRETTVVKTVAPIAQTSSKKRAPVVKMTETPKTVVPQSKTETAEVFDKRGNVKPAADKKNAVKNQASTSTKGDVFTRPRVVKNPKF